MSMKKVYATITPIAQRRSLSEKLVLRLLGTCLAPINWLVAHRYQTPGLYLHGQSIRLGIRQIFSGKPRPLWQWVYHFLFSPCVLTRYFEFDFTMQMLKGEQPQRYLDVSSPFMLPILLIGKYPSLKVDLINPDKNDLPVTKAIIESSGFSQRSQLHDCLIDNAPFPNNTFDVITSISVVEHIPENKQAIQKMWDILRPGGQLILTVPCARKAYELHTNMDHYGILGEDQSGYTFLEYVYDQKLLEENIYSVTGKPEFFQIYGEKQKDFLRNELIRRWNGEYWRYWQEPIMMGKEFQYYPTIEDLPGEGVIALKFVKRTR